MFAKSITLSILVLSMLWTGGQPAMAAMSRNTIAPQAILNTSGGQILATVQLACEEGETVAVRATFNQRSTGAVAEGQAYGHCTGDVIYIPVVLTGFGAVSFTAGEANGCALAISFMGSQVTDAHQWCRAESVTLEEGSWPQMSPDRSGRPFSGRGGRGHHRH